MIKHFCDRCDSEIKNYPEDGHQVAIWLSPGRHDTRCRIQITRVDRENPVTLCTFCITEALRGQANRQPAKAAPETE